ncbi:hypothetical protein GBAR_LOCUS6342, partial [Geodia barretti]
QSPGHFERLSSTNMPTSKTKELAKKLGLLKRKRKAENDVCSSRKRRRGWSNPLICNSHRFRVYLLERQESDPGNHRVPSSATRPGVRRGGG